MRRHLVFALSCLATFAAAAPVRAQLLTDDAVLLADVGRTYAALHRYLFAGHFRLDLTGARGPQTQESDFFVAADGQGKMRDEIVDAAQGGAFVSDGTQTWVYNAAFSQWTRRPGDADSVLKDSSMRGVGRALLDRYAMVARGVLAARRLTDESVSVDGVSRGCYVLEVKYPPSTQNTQIKEGPRTYWIERKTHLILRQRTTISVDMPQFGGPVEQTETIEFTHAQSSPTLSDTLWRFRPPAGAHEVAAIGPERPQAAKLDGKPAIDFTLRDLAGKSHSLAAARGKVVLLDFWATWCGPCRLTMPRVAKIDRDYRARGVEVWSINIGEPAARAGAYIKKNGYQFTTLLDIDQEVATHYMVTGIPTLVIVDRTGTISSYLVGAHEEQTLRDALAKAGVK